MTKKVIVITGSDKAMHPVLDLTIPSKIRYAQKHGYDFLCIRSFEEIKELNLGSDLISIGFIRAIKCFQMIEHYDYVMWLDADSIVTNDSLDIGHFIKMGENKTFFASYDWLATPNGLNGHSGFNSGNFIIRRTEFVSELFSTFISLIGHFINDTGADQSTLNYIHRQTHLRDIFCILDQKYLNPVPEDIYETSVWASDPNRVGPNKKFSITSPWDKDCFIAHLTGCSTEDRISLFSKNFKQYL